PCPHLCRVADELRQPVAVATLGDAAQVRPDPVADPDRMAGRAYFLEHRLARLGAERIADIARRIVWHNADFLAPLRIHGKDCEDQPVDIAEHRIAGPFAGLVIAEHDLVAMVAQILAALAELVVDGPDVLRLSGDKRPSCASPEGLRVFLEPIRS